MLHPDLRDLLSAFCAADVRFLVVGAYAVGIHSRPRATKGLDVWVDASRANAPRVMAALRAFGAPLHDLTDKDFQSHAVTLQLGAPPHRIDVLTALTGLSFRSAWPGRITVRFGDDLVCPVIGLPALLRNKKATARPQDLVDAAALEREAARWPLAKPPARRGETRERPP